MTHSRVSTIKKPLDIYFKNRPERLTSLEERWFNPLLLTTTEAEKETLYEANKPSLENAIIQSFILIAKNEIGSYGYHPQTILKSIPVSKRESFLEGLGFEVFFTPKLNTTPSFALINLLKLTSENYQSALLNTIKRPTPKNISDADKKESEKNDPAINHLQGAIRNIEELIGFLSLITKNKFKALQDFFSIAYLNIYMLKNCETQILCMLGTLDKDNWGKALEWLKMKDFNPFNSIETAQKAINAIELVPEDKRYSLLKFYIEKFKPTDEKILILLLAAIPVDYQGDFVKTWFKNPNAPKSAKILADVFKYDKKPESALRLQNQLLDKNFYNNITGSHFICPFVKTKDDFILVMQATAPEFNLDLAKVLLDSSTKEDLLRNVIEHIPGKNRAQILSQLENNALRQATNSMDRLGYILEKTPDLDKKFQLKLTQLANPLEKEKENNQKIDFKKIAQSICRLPYSISTKQKLLLSLLYNYREQRLFDARQFKSWWGPKFGFSRQDKVAGVGAVIKIIEEQEGIQRIDKIGATNSGQLGDILSAYNSLTLNNAPQLRDNGAAASGIHDVGDKKSFSKRNS